MDNYPKATLETAVTRTIVFNQAEARKLRSIIKPDIFEDPYSRKIIDFTLKQWGVGIFPSPEEYSAAVDMDLEILSSGQTVQDLRSAIHALTYGSLQSKMLALTEKASNGKLSTLEEMEKYTHQIEEAVREIKTRLNPAELVDIGDGLDLYQERAKGLRDGTFSYPVLDFWPAVSERLGPLRGLTMLIGPTGSGKSRFSQNLSIELARKGHPVFYYSTEMNIADIAERLATIASADKNITIKSIYDYENIEKAIKALRDEQLPIYVAYSNNLKADAITETMETVMTSYRHPVMVVDQITSMDTAMSPQRAQAMEEAAAAIQKTGATLQIPIFAIAQTRREAKEPMPSDIGWSFGVSQQAEAMLGLKILPDTGLCAVEVVKNRFGAEGDWTAPIHFSIKGLLLEEQEKMFVNE